jgi:carboxyl-terminal processing protease
MLRLPTAVVGTVAGAALFMLGFMSGRAQIKHEKSTPSVETRQLEPLGKMIDIVRSDHVDIPDNGKLITSAINGVLGALDPRSGYIDNRSFRDLMVGHAVSIGMQVIMEDGVLTVVSPVDGTPAAMAGLLAGDVITQIDDIPIKGFTLDQAVVKMRGGPRTEVRLEIARPGEVTPRKLTLTRQMRTVSTVRQKVEGSDVGYVRLAQFDSQVADELKKAIEALATTAPPEQFKGYILDLRNNPGGLLDQAVRVAGAFMTSGGEIVSVRGRNPEQLQRFNAAPGDLIDGKPLIVLINGGSYSASEIVAGALQDHQRATIVGSRTFGKASVQTLIPLGRGNGAIRLTTARYFTPLGRSIEAQGIAPDIEVLQDVPKELAQMRTRSEYSETSLPGLLKAAGDEHKGPQSYIPKDAKDDTALQIALALIRGTETNPAFSPKRKQGAAEP